MFLGINIFIVTDSESSGPKSEALTSNQVAFITRVRMAGRPPEVRKFRMKQKMDTSRPRILTVNKLLCYGKLNPIAVTTIHIIIKQSSRVSKKDSEGAAMWKQLSPLGLCRNTLTFLFFFSDNLFLFLLF